MPAWLRQAEEISTRTRNKHTHNPSGFAAKLALSVPSIVSAQVQLEPLQRGAQGFVLPAAAHCVEEEEEQELDPGAQQEWKSWPESMWAQRVIGQWCG